MTGALIILGVLVLTGLVLYLFHRRDVRRGRALAPTRGPMQDVPEGEDSVCCGMHSTCEKDSLLASVSDKIEYLMMRSLIVLPGGTVMNMRMWRLRSSVMFLLTLLPEDVAPWARSIQLRGD